MIDCVQLQVRVHSAQQQSRPLLASPPASFKNDSSIVCEYLSTSRAFLPASAKWPPSLGPRLGQSNSSLWRQNGYYAILDENNSYPTTLPLLAPTLTPDLCCFQSELCSGVLHESLISVTTAKQSRTISKNFKMQLTRSSIA